MLPIFRAPCYQPPQDPQDSQALRIGERRFDMPESATQIRANRVSIFLDAKGNIPGSRLNRAGAF